MKLKLGTGGYHYIITILNNVEKNLSNNTGHIMKMRYTPHQIRCSTLEEEESRYHDVFNENPSLDNSIYVVGGLHSMIEPLAASIKYLKPHTKICYIMTDGGALPLQFSKTIKRLKNKSLIDKTITIGHAFGGDYECVNIYSGIIASKKIINADITIITMGPGIVGTNTKYGFSGIEQGHILDAIVKFGGNAISIPRVSFKDDRPRHRGISHHTITVLKEIVNNKVKIVFPTLEKEKSRIIEKQLIENQIYNLHDVYYFKGDVIQAAIKNYDLNPVTMGRNFEQNKEFYYTMGAVGSFICSNYL